MGNTLSILRCYVFGSTSTSPEVPESILDGYLDDIPERTKSQELETIVETYRYGEFKSEPIDIPVVYPKIRDQKSPTFLFYS